MSNLAVGVPKAAQELLEAIAHCTEEIEWKDGTYLHPKGKVVFQGVVTPGDKRPDGSRWMGEKPQYLIVYNHPRNHPGMCDAHWFELDVVNVDVEAVVETSDLNDFCDQALSNKLLPHQKQWNNTIQTMSKLPAELTPE